MTAPTFAPLVSALVLATGMGLAHAGTVQLTVNDKDGKPVPDVVVLLEQAVKTVPRPAAKPVIITQEGSRFVPFLTVVPVGSTATKPIPLCASRIYPAASLCPVRMSVHSTRTAPRP